MATNFPGSVDNASTVGDGTHPSADELLSSTDGGPAHHALHQNVGLAINAIEDKLGVGASTPVAGSVLTGTGSGTSAWLNDPLYVDTTNDRVGIGTTSPTSELDVRGTFVMRRETAVGSGTVIASNIWLGTDSTNPGTDDFWIAFRRGNGTTLGSVRGTGSASVNFATTSDETLKVDRGIVDAEQIGSIVDALRIHEFDWVEGELSGQIGLFAQEALLVLPESIVTPPSSVPSEVDGEPDEYVPASLDYSKIVPILIAECQFLRQRLATLEALETS